MKSLQFEVDYFCVIDLPRYIYNDSNSQAKILRFIKRNYNFKSYSLNYLEKCWISIWTLQACCIGIFVNPNLIPILPYVIKPRYNPLNWVPHHIDVDWILFVKFFKIEKIQVFAIG